MTLRHKALAAFALTGVALLAALAASLFLWRVPQAAAAGEAAARAAPDAAGFAWGYAAAAAATALSSLGAGFAVANVGTAAVGAITEKPELFGRMLILVGLAEGIAIYGLIVAILILERLG
jgi:V/A-type H+-transporting ATPase subunit K